jgi:hypothetical protein
MRLGILEKITLWKELPPLFKGMAEGKLDSIKITQKYKKYDSFNLSIDFFPDF